MKKRVVITGLGAISSLGDNISEMIENLNQSKIRYEEIPSERFSTMHKVFRNNKGFMIRPELYFDALQKDSYLIPEITEKCILEALDDATLKVESLREVNSGLSLGTSVGASYALMERIKGSLAGKDDYKLGLFSTSKIMGNIAKRFEINGPVSTISTACASGTNSIGRAFDLIENGRADIMIAGGVDVFTELTYTGFNSLFALSESNCKPFSASRDGMSLGDACGIMILESLDRAIERGAKIYAEVKGYHILNEAYHATAPHPDGKYALKCMKQAVSNANLTVEKIQYINAHGTGTHKNDGAEFIACEKLLKDKETKTYVGSTKCLTGHTLGASGSIEAILSVLSINHETLYAQYIADDLPDSEKVDFITNNRTGISVDHVLSNSFGFGGNMASIVLSKYYS